jgi:Spx/MgsR family transcriptional regulator
MITLYGIKTCGTCRNALKWLDAEGIPHQYHDFRANGLDEATLSRWIDALGWETLLNRRGTTWRGLSDEDKADVDASRAKALMLAKPTLIKRPVFDLDGSFVVGFTDTEKEQLRAQH